MIIAQKSKRFSYMKRYWILYLMLLLPMAFFIIFRYIPMGYIQIAFKNYSIIKSPWEMDWAANNGFEYFIKAFSNRDFLYALRNTFGLNVLDLVFGFPAPIILAIILNELAFKRFKRFTQTVVYMPHFLSWVIISGMALQLLAPTTGLLNIMLNKMGFASIPFLNDSFYWVITYVVLGIWQSCGWNTIIYLAAIAGINPELYEAASVDGASRLRKIWHITLPGLRPTIIILLILSLGQILGSEFDRPYALSNKLVSDVSNVISIFVYNYGIRGLQFSLSTAVGLFQSVVCVIFLFAANALAKKSGDRGIWLEVVIMIKSKGTKIGDWIIVLICLWCVLVCLLPVLNILARSLSSADALVRNEVILLPVGFNFEAYALVLGDSKYTWALLWTAMLTVMTTLWCMFMTIMAAYPLIYDNLKGKRLIMAIIIFTMYFNAGTIPTYLLLKELHLLNNPLVLIIPGSISVFYLIIMRSFFYGIPESLKESAELDGAGPVTVLINIYLPLSAPVLATLSLFYAVGRWNGFSDALMFMNDRTYFPIQLLLYNILNSITSVEVATQEGFTSPGLSETIKSATVMFATIPILLVYPWLQRYFISGVTIGAVKG